MGSSRLHRDHLGYIHFHSVPDGVLSLPPFICRPLNAISTMASRTSSYGLVSFPRSRPTYLGLEGYGLPQRQPVQPLFLTAQTCTAREPLLIVDLQAAAIDRMDLQRSPSPRYIRSQVRKVTTRGVHETTVDMSSQAMRVGAELWRRAVSAGVAKFTDTVITPPPTTSDNNRPHQMISRYARCLGA